MMRKYFYSIYATPTLILFFLFSSTLLQAKEPPPSKLFVKGSATLYKPADQLVMQLSVITSGTTAEEALASNAPKMEGVIAAIEKLGITKQEYQTGRFNVRPQYTPYPQNPPPNWKATINGYEVTNSITIKTDKTALVGKIIDETARAGANNIDNLYFGLKDEQIYRAELITLATQNAIADAKALANAAGAKLANILLIGLDEARPVEPQYLERHSYAKMETSSSQPIEPGNVSLHATVNVTYRLE